MGGELAFGECGDEHGGGSIELRVAVEQQREVILRDSCNFGIVAGAEFLAFFQVDERVGVVLGLEFAEAEKVPCWANGWSEFDELLEGGDRIGVAVGAVFERAQVEPTLLPVGSDTDGAPVVFDRGVGVAGVAGCRGGFGYRGEVGLRCLRGGRRAGLKMARRGTRAQGPCRESRGSGVEGGRA